ncbi:LysM peptidoglycan-binding domain-containing protein [Candidatus Gracilibacteria bacterium]|nr:LysM peptidoglycan-binding domain-containing protein [Candidatus Gracilibacteria bacterium]MCF7855936.1 LysM peptidoglycan-binding domain-containing protein [Candidatus Gracilibacteria bacterium]MCF7896371.1 LysM peptidoglycan-binding domain-containing protein [Candidatus Gracilibacteria bacterium]
MQNKNKTFWGEQRFVFLGIESSKGAELAMSIDKQKIKANIELINTIPRDSKPWKNEQYTKRIQMFLNGIGIPTEENGKYDAATIESVKKYQEFLKNAGKPSGEKGYFGKQCIENSAALASEAVAAVVQEKDRVETNTKKEMGIIKAVLERVQKGEVGKGDKEIVVVDIHKITVKPGETLSKIAKRYKGKMNIAEAMNLIAKHNNIKDINKIEVGQELEIPLKNGVLIQEAVHEEESSPENAAEKLQNEALVEVTKMLENKFKVDILSLETKTVTPKEFEKFLEMTREINEAAFDFTNGFLRDKFPTQDEKISGKILGGVRNLATLAISQLFTTALNLPMYVIGAEKSHMSHVLAAGGEPNLLLVNSQNTEKLANNITFGQLFIEMLGETGNGKRAATAGMPNNIAPKVDTLMIASDINGHNEKAQESAFRIAEGKGNLANAMAYFIEKIGGLRYFLRKDDPNGDPDKYLKILKEEMGVDIDKDEVIKQMAMNALLSGGMINQAWKGLKFIFGKDKDGKIEPIGVTIFGRRIMLPELSTNLNTDNISQQIDVPIRWNKDTLVIPGLEKAMLGNTDVPMEARLKLVKKYAESMRVEAEAIVNTAGATRFAGGIRGSFETEGGTKVGYSAEGQTAGAGTLDAARNNPSQTVRAHAEVSLEKDGNYLNFGAGYNENGVALDAAIGINGEISPDNLHPAAQAVFRKLGIAPEKWVQLAEAGYLRSVKGRLTGFIHEGVTSEKEINANFGVDLFGKTAVFGEVDVNVVAGVNAGIGSNSRVAPYMMVRSGKFAEILASPKMISAYFKFGKKYKGLVGGVIDSKGNAGPAIGGEVLPESGVGKSLTLAYTGEDLILENWIKKSYIWGDENKVVRFGLMSGAESFSIQNPGKMEVNKQGQIEAYNAINTREGLLLLFQHQDKPREIKNLIVDISKHLEALWGSGKNTYFSEEFLEGISSKENLLRFDRRVLLMAYALSNFMKEDETTRVKNLDSIIFSSLDGETNEYNDATGDLKIGKIDGELPDFEKMKIRQVELPQGYNEGLKQNLEDFQKKFGFVVEGAEELDAVQQKGLVNLFKLISNGLENRSLDLAKILNKQIKFTEGMSWRGFGEALNFVSRHSFRDAEATMNLNKSVLESFAESYIGDTKPSSEYAKSEEFEKYSKKKQLKINEKVSFFEKDLLSKYKSQLGVVDVLFIPHAEFEKDFPDVYSDQEGKQERLFGKKGQKLYVNINELAYSSKRDIEKKMGKALGNEDFLRTISFLEKSKTQKEIGRGMRMASGAAEAKLYDLRPKQLKAPKVTEGKITYEYTIDDVYGDAIKKENSKGVEYKNDYKIEISTGKIEVTMQAGDKVEKVVVTDFKNIDKAFFKKFPELLLLIDKLVEKDSKAQKLLFAKAKPKTVI